MNASHHMIRVATIISRVLQPMIVLVVLSVLAGIHAGLSGAAFVRYLLVLFGFLVLPVVAVQCWLVLSGRVKDWDIHTRKERVKPLLMLLVFVGIFMGVIAGFHNTELTRLFLTFLVWLVGFFLVTLVWKISGHASISALASGILVMWYGPGFWPVLLIVPLVGWSRVVRRDHTLMQVIVGSLYSWALVISMSRF
jgi:hypothetical protein